MTYAHPEFLVETDWLEDHLSDPDLRIFDCTVQLELKPEGGYVIESGKPIWDKGHIPGAGFLDLRKDLSDPEQKLLFMMPSPERFAAAMSAAGVGEGTHVVLYSTTTTAWATRIWWMLRAFGFDNAAVLNGGWKKWQAEGRPISTDAPSYPQASFEAHPRAGMMAEKTEVLDAIGADNICLLNSLPTAIYDGDMTPYARPGHIASSVNLPTVALEDPDTGAFLPANDLQERLDGVGASSGQRVITYCGGGIAATHNAFALSLLGHDDVAVYDASMSEWATDPDAPMEVG